MLRLNARAGTNTATIRRRLRPGRYTVVVWARTAGGQVAVGGAALRVTRR